MEITDVKLRNSYQVCHVWTNNIFIKCGTTCVVETEHGMDIGRITRRKVKVDDPDNEVKGKLLRLPTKEDLEVLPEIEAIEQKAFSICRTKAKEKVLDMKLISVKCLLDKTKIIFYFVADNRIDFRELVRDLASVFRTRIEMRQIGVRDEARLIGGYGPCGRQLCCTHMKEGFDPVSIKMAKEQSLNLNSMKISGMCGRLLCCLGHEYSFYKEINKGLPSIGAEIHVGKKKYVVEGIDALRETVKMRYDNYTVDVSAKHLVYARGNYSVSDEVVQKLVNNDEDEGDETGYSS